MNEARPRTFSTQAPYDNVPRATAAASIWQVNGENSLVTVPLTNSVAQFRYKQTAVVGFAPFIIPPVTVAQAPHRFH